MVGELGQLAGTRVGIVGTGWMVRAGELGEPRYVTGSYHQDWLLEETDWNWRLVAGRQGSLRAVADIGSHWLDLVSFVSGRRVTEVLADLHTFVPERNHPLGEVGTFAASGVADDVERVREPMSSDDAAGILLRLEGGMRGVCSVSQVSAGRKNRLSWELNGSRRSLAWTSEEPEYLWVGHRGRPNELSNKDPGLMSGPGAAVTGYPAGHVEGYPDTFRGLFAAVYADVAAARRYAGVSHIDVAGLSDAQAKELAGDLAGRGIEISGLGYYPNPLHPDPAVRDEALAHLRAPIGGAAPP